MNKDIYELLSLLNEDDTNLYELNIYFEDGYEISFNENDTAQLWKNTPHTESYTYMGIIDSYFEDLVEFEGITVDINPSGENKTVQFIGFSYK